MSTKAHVFVDMIIHNKEKHVALSATICYLLDVAMIVVGNGTSFSLLFLQDIPVKTEGTKFPNVID